MIDQPLTIEPGIVLDQLEPGATLIPIDTLAGRMAQTSAAAPAAGAAPATAGTAASTGRPRTSIFTRGLEALETPTAVLSNDQQASVAYARNVDVEQDAPGGPNPAPVPVTVAWYETLVA